jgi:uncharacterized membrane protein
MNRKLQKQTDKLTDNRREQIVVSHQFSGPIPPPDTLEKYNQIIPGAAERILNMAENEAASRQRNDEKLINNIVRSSFLGIFFAFASVILLSLLAYYALMNDYPVVASGIVVVIASVAGVFIFFRNKRPFRHT